MEHCQSCGGLLDSFPVDIKDVSVYDCSRCGLVFINRFEGVLHEDKGVKQVPGVTFKEVMEAYRVVDPKFEDLKKPGKMSDAEALEFRLRFDCSKVKLPPFLALALIPYDDD